jgi:hypothetical protein
VARMPDATAASPRRKLPLWAKQIIWHLDGHAGRSIRFWIRAKGLRYCVGVGLAERLCRGPHTDGWQSNDGDRCLCDRVRRRLDFIPF